MENLNTVPDTMPDDVISRLIPVYETFGIMLIQMEMEFPQKLDTDRLSKAISLSLDAEPKLGYRYVTHWRKPYWKRMERHNGNILTIARSEREYEVFRHTGIDAYTGPQLRVCLLEPGDVSHLLIKVSHHVADADGVKDVTRLIASIYNSLGNNPDYSPKQNISLNDDIKKVLDTVPREEFPRLRRQNKETRRVMHTKNGIHRLIFNNKSDDNYTYVIRMLDRNHVSNLAVYGKENNATLNDLLLAAFFRAQTKVGNWDGKKQLCVQTTVDCRRYLPDHKASTITNLAWGYPGWPCLSTDLGDDFLQTLKKIVVQTRQRKENYIGVDALIENQGLLRLAPMMSRFKKPVTNFIKKMTEKGMAPDALRNMGPIDPDAVNFGCKPTQARLLTILASSPFFTLGVSGYDGTLTLSAGIDSSQEQLVNHFFDIMIEELSI